MLTMKWLTISFIMSVVGLGITVGGNPAVGVIISSGATAFMLLSWDDLERPKAAEGLTNADLAPLLDALTEDAQAVIDRGYQLGKFHAIVDQYHAMDVITGAQWRYWRSVARERLLQDGEAVLIHGDTSGR
jgi:hypothetical protein